MTNIKSTTGISSEL